MEKLRGLKDLLLHEIQDLYSAEEQIIEAMPLMIGKAKDEKLVRALKEHLKITEQQKVRLDEVKQLLISETASEGAEETKSNGFFGNLFGGSSDSKQVCRGMQGLIEEGQKVMAEEMAPKVLDAAIIACAQKIEHYEICGYGTARAYARELELGEVAEKLEETLDEEYEADDLLTDLAVGGLNEQAETGNLRRGGSRKGQSSGAKSGGKKAAKAAPKKAAKKSAPKKSSSGKGSSKGSSRTNKSKAPAKSQSKKSAGKGKSSSSKGSKSRAR